MGKSRACPFAVVPPIYMLWIALMIKGKAQTQNSIVPGPSKISALALFQFFSDENLLMIMFFYPSCMLRSIMGVSHEELRGMYCFSSFSMIPACWLCWHLNDSDFIPFPERDGSSLPLYHNVINPDSPILPVIICLKKSPCAIDVYCESILKSIPDPSSTESGDGISAGVLAGRPTRITCDQPPIRK